VDDAKARIEAARRLARCSFLDYLRAVAPWLIIEETHALIAQKLDDLAFGRISRLMLFLPPRAGKSLLGSVYFPSWYLGLYPTRKIMCVSYSEDLAIKFGRQVRDLLKDVDFQSIFPGVHLRSDVKAAGHWQVASAEVQDSKQHGEYYAAGVGTGIAGKGWNLGIIDDPLSEQDAVSDIAKQNVWDWYGPGFYTRRQPDFSQMLVISTRWAKDDLPGRLLRVANENKEDEFADQWEVLDVPALIDSEAKAKQLNAVADEIAELHQGIENAKAKRDGRLPFEIPPNVFEIGSSFAPRRWPLKELLKQKANMPPRSWLALYQQKPTEEDGRILKRKYWLKWPHTTPPKCAMTIATYDTAFEEDEENDFSARTTWGIFRDEYSGRWSCILLERMNRRLEFNRLIDNAVDHARYWRPDIILIEKRASGEPLVRTLRRKGLPAKAWLPPGGRFSKGKLPRAHIASEVLEDGVVYFLDRDWAHEVIDQCAAFPADEHDDMVDTVTMALLWLRQGYLQLETEWDELDARMREEDEEDAGASERLIFGTKIL
jgi:predicted phage terminase large subunit-like protein